MFSFCLTNVALYLEVKKYEGMFCERTQQMRTARLLCLVFSRERERERHELPVYTTVIRMEGKKSCSKHFFIFDSQFRKIECN